MNRLKQLFREKSADKDLLNIYFTAGFPALDQTVEIMEALQKAGADIIELGIPFSDPLADGPTIQQSSERALSNGMSLDVLFEQLKNMRTRVQIPIIMMGYLNPIMQYGLTRFLEQAKQVGIDGFIFPDVPMSEFEKEWKEPLEALDLTFSFLVTPQTTPSRVRQLDALTSGFLYAVSSSSTTGGSSTQQQEKQVSDYLRTLKSLKLKNPILAGFGIRSQADYHRINSEVDGAIIGSAFIKHLDEYGATEEHITQFVHSLKAPLV